MAKTITRAPSRPVVKPTLVVGGKAFIVKEDYKISEHGNIVPAGHTLRELNTGWYRLYKPDGDKHFLTIGPVLMKKLVIEAVEIK